MRIFLREREGRRDTYFLRFYFLFARERERAQAGGAAGRSRLPTE